MNKIILCLTLPLSQLSWSATATYEVKGILGPNPVDKKKSIDFTLHWSETDNRLTGTYEDNFYTKQVPLKGVSSERGRIIVVTLPEDSQGVRTISFLGSETKPSKDPAKVSWGMVLRDAKGNPVRSQIVQGQLALIPPPPASAPAPAVVAQRQEAPPCQEGFGSLAGFCGTYKGLLTEEEDSTNKCDLLSFSAANLVMDDNAELGITLGAASDLVNSPVHRIGRASVNPENTNIDLMSRSCRPLPGTTFRGDDCKRVSLIGSFSQAERTKHFTGTYTIVDENSNESCRYSLSMDLGL